MSILDLPVGAPLSFGLSSLEWVVAEVSEGPEVADHQHGPPWRPGATNSHHVGGPPGAADDADLAAFRTLSHAMKRGRLIPLAACFLIYKM